MLTVKKTTWWPIVAITLIATLSFSVSLWLLYQTAYQRQLRDLVSTADTLASILDAVGQYNHQNNPELTREENWRISMKQFEQGILRSSYQAGDQELLIGHLDGNVIRIVRRGHSGIETLNAVTFDGKLAQPLYHALQGERGSGEYLDYAGTRVLAGYAPVTSLGIGIVLKIPHDQMIRPFIKSSAWAAGILLLMVSLFVSGFIRYRRRAQQQLEMSEIKNQDKLQRAETLSNTIIDTTGALVLVLDNQGRICQFNHACETLSGYTFAEVEGKCPWDTVLPPDEADSIRINAFEALTNNPQSPNGNHTNYWLSKNGSRHLIYWVNTLVNDAHDKMKLMVSVGTDITRQATIEKHLREQAEIIDQIHDSVIATDLNGFITSWNKGSERMFGYTASEILGQYIARVYAEDELDILENQIIPTLKENDQLETEVILKKKNGETFHGHLSLSMLYDTEHQPIGMIGYTMDITARKQAEATAQETTKLLHLIIEHVPMMIFMKRADDLSFELFNRAGEELTGISRTELIGKNDSDLFPAEQAAFFTQRDRHVLDVSGNEDIPEELLNTRSNGQRILHTKKFALNDINGRPVHLLGISEDITERKHNNDLITSANQLLNAVLDTTPVMIAYLDNNMNFLRVNHAYAQADGKTPDYFIGRHHFALYPNAENEAIFQRVVETGLPHHVDARPFEYQNNPERGTSHWDWTLTPIKDSDNRVTGLVLSLMNVTDRIQALETVQHSEYLLKNLNEELEARVNERTRELNQQMQSNALILDTTLDGFFSADINSRILTANPAFCTLLGYTQEELLRMSVADFEANEKKEEVRAHIETIMAIGHDRFQTRHRRKDGSLVDIEISVTLVEIGNKKELYAFAHNISPYKETQAALMAARDEAERANHAKSEFLSRMSHELRTPMNAILGFSQVLQLEKLEAIEQNYVQEILDAGNHLLSLINELLDLSRIEVGKLATAIQAIEVAASVTEALHIIHPLIDKQNIMLLNDCRSNMMVYADRTRLRQILINLLSNAAKYNTTDGFIHIDCEPSCDDMLRISITDTGIGIAQDKLNNLYQPFERLGAENSKVEGSGIGLALSKQLIELMGGAIGVDSTQGQGSTFWFELPIASISTPVQAIHSSQQVSNFTGRDMVLYIEDNTANLKVVEAIFKRYPNLQLITATNGRYGIELAQQYQPAVILLDIHLPDINGYTVLAELGSRDATRHIPVVALSADALPMDIEKGLKAGFHAYLTKPLKIDTMMATLEKLFAK
jgi:PAS domain S-box-containing protein